MTRNHRTTVGDPSSKSQFLEALPDDWYLLRACGKLLVRERQMVSFSERMGITQPKGIQLQGLDADLRNSLWNVCYEYWFTSTIRSGELSESDMYQLAVALQRDLYKQPINMLIRSASDFVHNHMEFFKIGQWYSILNMVEFLRNQFVEGSMEQQHFEMEINEVLERKKSAYRFIAAEIAPITNEIEIRQIEAASQYGARFLAASEHIKTALHLYSKKPDPDYRNSIKESISAVEAAVRIISNNPKAELGDALKIMDASKPIHGAFKQALLKLYGYTSDEGGIRHSLVESTNIDESDARFMLVTCSAFVNYFISRS
jgi:hypothetical protein